MTVHELVLALPRPEDLRARCRAVALLDAIVSVPYAPSHMFAVDWRPGVDLAFMDNGSGDQYAVVFDPVGVFLYGFDHESDATPWREEDRAHWPGLLDGLPAPLAPYTQAEEFLFDGFFDATVCAWYETGSTAWRCGPVEFTDGDTDGADWLFDLLTAPDGTRAFADYAQDYYTRTVDEDAVAAVFNGAPLDRRTVTALSAHADFATIAGEARALGYPVDDS
ncbi:hypothetical protein ACIRD3_34215 [Kitasatospora sp. NPDC093550]|uniref:hypothetical protein n=1 Tax=Kitasatospora sp. NPDC093550 TaxID=3364089 RepID=UPI00380A241F